MDEVLESVFADRNAGIVVRYIGRAFLPVFRVGGEFDLVSDQVW